MMRPRFAYASRPNTCRTMPTTNYEPLALPFSLGERELDLLEAEFHVQAVRREGAIVAAMEKAAGTSGIEAAPDPPRHKPGGGIVVYGLDPVKPWPVEYDPSDPGEPGLEVRRLDRALVAEAERQHEEREALRRLRSSLSDRPQGYVAAPVSAALAPARHARRESRGAPTRTRGSRRSGSRPSGRSSDSGDGGSSDPESRAPRGPAPSPRFSRPWRRADAQLRKRVAVLRDLGDREEM